MPHVTGHTRLFAILADPIYQVKTPEVMHDVFARHGIDGVLVPMHVPPEGLARAVEGLRQMRNFGGFIATMPHKTAMLGLCDRVVGDAAGIGAVNCVRREADGSMVGAMLDGDGFVAGLRRAGVVPGGQRVVLAGAGGAGAAIAFALAGAGVARLTILNRSLDRAEDLARRVAAAYPGVVVAARAAGRDPALRDETAAAGIVVNATALGMRPGDPLPVDPEGLHAGQVVAEAIMDPVETPLLAEAARRGARTQPGLPMLACQIEMMACHMGALPGTGTSKGPGTGTDKIPGTGTDKTSGTGTGKTPGTGPHEGPDRTTGTGPDNTGPGNTRADTGPEPGPGTAPDPRTGTV